MTNLTNPIFSADMRCDTQIGNLQAISQFLCNFSKSFSGTLADILSPARMVIYGTLLTTLNKPMFAASGFVFHKLGTLPTLYLITAGKGLVHSSAVLLLGARVLILSSLSNRESL